MGTFRVRIEVGDPERARFVPIEALVDTGSTYTVLPRALLEELSVPVDRRALFVLADGTEVDREIGRTWVRFDGLEEFTLVVFGDDALLGAVTIEEFLLAPDPSSGQLVPVRGLMMHMAA